MMKRIISLLLLITASTKAAPFTFQGDEYLDGELIYSGTNRLPSWKPGEEEPPLLPNQAYLAAKSAFNAQFGKKTDVILLSVELRHQPSVSAGTKALTFYQVIFGEKLSDAEMKKRLVPVEGYSGVTKAYSANMSYYVLMDGTGITPRKKAKQPTAPTAKAERHQ